MPVLYDFLHQLVNGAAPDWILLILAAFIPVFIVINVILPVSGGSTYIERKLAADIQRRVGPNQCNVNAFMGEFARIIVRNASLPKAGFSAKLMALLAKPALPILDLADRVVSKLAPGVIIFMADGLKLIMKEDIIPAAVDRPLFKLAPMIVLASAFGALAVLPYSDAWYVADLNIGIFYIAAITSIEVIGILMAGWASNNKWALLGGMRSVAQIVSYELPAGLAIATGMLINGSMSMQAMTYNQFQFGATAGWMQGWFWQWNIFHPAMFILAPCYFLAALAECNRTPFDIPEAESELVSGYHTEYSGMRFGFFFMAEYAMMCVTSAIGVTLFLGGWSTGIGPLEQLLMKTPPMLDHGILVAAPQFYWFGTLIHLGAFIAKTYSLVLLMMWIRWTLPRFRVDQMMDLCWKKLIPLSMFCFLAVGAWIVLEEVLNAAVGASIITGVTFWLRLVFALAVGGWLVWFFKLPLTTAQRSERTALAHADASGGVSL